MTINQSTRNRSTSIASDFFTAICVVAWIGLLVVTILYRMGGAIATEVSRHLFGR